MSQRSLRAVDSGGLEGLTDVYAQFMESSERVQGLLPNLILENQTNEETIAALNEELRIAREREREAHDRNAATEELLISERSSAAEATAAAVLAHQEATAAADLAHREATEHLRGKAAEAIRRIDEFRRFQISELESGHRRGDSVPRTGSLPALAPSNPANEGGVRELIETETQKAQYLRDEGDWVDAIVAQATQHTNEESESLPWVKYDTQGRTAVLILDGDSLAASGWPDLWLHDARRELIRSLVLLAESSALQMDVMMGSDAAPDLTQDLPLRVRLRILREDVPITDTLMAISETYADQPRLIVSPDEEFQLSGTAPLKFADALRSLAGNSGQSTTY